MAKDDLEEELMENMNEFFKTLNDIVVGDITVRLVKSKLHNRDDYAFEVEIK
jgi:hypothetical protein